MQTDPLLMSSHNLWSRFELSGGLSATLPLDPRPVCGGAAFQDVENVAASTVADSFFDAVNFKGAFGSVNWLNGWSFVNTHGGFVSSSYTCPTAAEASEPVSLCPAGVASHTLTTDVTWMPGRIYVMTCQVFVPSGKTLAIGAGTTIYSTPKAIGGAAPALVVLKGGKVIADGTAASPITFTALNPERASSETVSSDSQYTATVLENRGKWGGIIVLGLAPTSASSPLEIEGITGYTYGGNVPTDGSGVMRYVRVWHGGAIVGANNEINGITFGGVGSGTVVDHCEVAFNADDGFEFFGGTVDVKYLSVLFVGDDAFDTDEGYRGRGQYLFAMTGFGGNHGTEMESMTNGNLNSQPRSHPAFYSMTIIGGGASGRTGEIGRAHV